MPDASRNVISSQVDELFDQVESLLDRCDSAHVRTRTTELVAKLNELDAANHRDTDDDHAALARQSQRIMMDNISKPLTINEISHLCNTSPTMLKQTFRAVIGTPIYQWYRKYRMTHAKELLERTALPIAQIASAVGYVNPSKFAKAFNDEIGETPHAWRARHHR